MKSIDIETILTIIFVMVDDWYQKTELKPTRCKTGRKAKFANSEVVTLMLASDFIPFPGEMQWVGYIKANHRALFPAMLSQSQFNRRARALRGHIERLRRSWLMTNNEMMNEQFLLDTKPIPIVGYKRSKKRSNFAGSAAFGYCASRKFHYYGYKLVMVTTLSGLPVAYDLVAANTDERVAAETVLSCLQNALVIGDKGFIGAEWQAKIRQQTGNQLLTPMRKNQKMQHPDGFEGLLNSVREQIEGTFHEIQNIGRHIERLLAKTVVGLVTRVAVKVTAHLLKLLLRSQYGIDVQSFQALPDSQFSFT
jgi:hypothetical protein